MLGGLLSGRADLAFGVALAVVAVIGFASAWRMQGWRYEARIAEIHNAHALSLAQAQATARAFEHRRIEEIEHVRASAQTQIDAMRADSARATATADRLRGELARVRASGTPDDPAATDRSARQSDSATADLLASVLSGMEPEARTLAQYADELRIAAQACEASYDSLRAARLGIPHAY